MSAWWRRSPEAASVEEVQPRTGAETAPLVLVADDDPLARGLLVAGLSRAGYRVREAEDGVAALAAARLWLPDMMLLDWMMPELLGVDVCAQVKADPQTRGIHVVMLTSVGDEAQVTEAFRSGANEYLTKPFNIAEVIALTGRAIGVPT